MAQLTFHVDRDLSFNGRPFTPHSALPPLQAPASFLEGHQSRMRLDSALQTPKPHLNPSPPSLPSHAGGTDRAEAMTIDIYAEEGALDENASEQSHGSIFGTPPTGTIGQTQPRAVIRIERDYSARGATTGRVQFWDGWIQEFEGRITPLQLQNTLNDINGILASAYDPYRSIFDNVLSIMTFYVSPLLYDTHYKKKMKLFSDTLDEYNKKVYNPVGLHILHPRKVAFLFLEIEYY